MILRILAGIGLLFLYVLYPVFTIVSLLSQWIFTAAGGITIVIGLLALLTGEREGAIAALIVGTVICFIGPAVNFLYGGYQWLLEFTTDFVFGTSNKE